MRRDDVKKRLTRVHYGAILGVIVALYIAVQLVQTIHHNYQLQQQITTLQGQLNDVQNQKDQLTYKIQYYQTDAYKEKEARAKLGLQQPGEGVVILPHKDEAQSGQSNQPKKAAVSHWQQWWNFLSGQTQ